MLDIKLQSSLSRVLEYRPKYHTSAAHSDRVIREERSIRGVYGPQRITISSI